MLSDKINVCPRCAGCGFEPDKPWKGEHRNWMVCSLCRNAAGLPEPSDPPDEAAWERQGRRPLSTGRHATQPTVIDGDDFVQACRDPKVIKLHDNARRYANELVARGHCPCHLVINCPKDD